MNASTDPDETVTRGDLFLVASPTFFGIFVPLESAALIIKPGDRVPVARMMPKQTLGHLASRGVAGV